MLKRLWMPCVLLAAVLLAACQGKTSGEPTLVAAATLPNQPTATHVPGCNVISQSPTPGPTQESLFPAHKEHDWTMGPDNASVSIIEYSDFQWPYCAQLAPVLAQIQKDNPNDVRIIYRHYPLESIHDKAELAAQAAESAGKQGKFWEMHDLLFAKQGTWKDMSVADFQTWLVTQADTLELNKDQFSKDLTSQAMADMSKQAWTEYSSIGIPGTPFLVINNQIWPDQVPMDYNNIDTVVKLTRLEAKQFTACPPKDTIDPTKQYFATLHTEKGDIKLQLFADKAPLAVSSFVFLARSGWFDNVIFHRVIPGFVAQAGDPTGTGYGGPGYGFDNEIIPGMKFDKEGLVGMANAGPGTNGSQFFITLGPAAQLDGSYTIFGQVVDGMDVVKSIAPRDPSQSPPLPPGDKILSVTIEEK